MFNVLGKTLIHQFLRDITNSVSHIQVNKCLISLQLFIKYLINPCTGTECPTYIAVHSMTKSPRASVRSACKYIKYKMY